MQIGHNVIFVFIRLSKDVTNSGTNYDSLYVVQEIFQPSELKIRTTWPQFVIINNFVNREI